MTIEVFEGREELGIAAANRGGLIIEDAIAKRGRASIILATGASQFATMDALVNERRVDWSSVTAFHLDEYIGLDANHPASFRRYLRERFVERIPKLAAFHFVQGDAEDPEKECDRLGRLLRSHAIDVAFLGIGENGHLAFNDPPADFRTENPYITVTLDEACRRQQLGEGWFASLEEVPERAISMSIRQILDSGCLILSVPDKRKAAAVRAAVEGTVTPMCPASILQNHHNCLLYLDKPSASELARP